VHGNEPGRATHQLHHSDAVRQVALRLDLRRGDRCLRGFHRRGEPEGAVDQIHVVVDRFGNARYGDIQMSLEALLGDDVCPAMRSITANHVKVLDAILLQEIDDYVDVETSTSRGQDGAALVVAVLDCLRSQHDRLVAWHLVKTQETAAVQHMINVL
jgi:hypothetical protein